MKTKLLIRFIILLTFCGGVNAVTQDALFGHKWYLSTFNQKDLELAKFDQKPYIQFQNDGTFASFIGCNQLSGTFRLTPPNGLQLSVATLPPDNPACDQNVVVVETQFIAALPYITAWDINKNLLDFKNNANDVTPVAVFGADAP
jgi:heat shock protein HslJ